MSDPSRPHAVQAERAVAALDSSWLLGQVDEALIAVPRSALVTVEVCPLSPAPPWASPWVGALALHGGLPVVALRLQGPSQARPETSTTGLIVVIGDGSWGLWIDALAGFGSGRAATGVHRQVPASWPCPISFVHGLTLSDGRAAWGLDPAAITARLCAAI